MDSQRNDTEERQQFLDDNQYTRNGILTYEKIFGVGFISTGGIYTTTELLQKVDLREGQNMLDIGCGIGGSAFYAANTYGAKVHGVDLSANMLSIANLRKATLLAPRSAYKVQFDHKDITTLTLQEETYDVIYSRDTIMHIQDKQSLFTNFLKWLKPGGRLLITDYCRGSNYSQEFDEYISQRNYSPLTIGQYRLFLEMVGFKCVNAEDWTDRFKAILQSELEVFKGQQSAFLKEFSSDDYLRLVSGWESKVQRCVDRTQAWGVFYAVKQG